MRLIAIHILLLGPVLASSGCLPSQQSPTKADLRASDTPSRVPAIVNAAESDDDATLAELVYALSDSDPAVRLFTIRSLADRTGETMGYRYYESVQKRQPAIDRWYDWLDNRSITPIEPAESDAEKSSPTPTD